MLEELKKEAGLIVKKDFLSSNQAELIMIN